MDGQDRRAPLDVGPIDDDLPIEATGTQKRRVEDVGTVRRRDQDHAGVRVEAVHFDQQLVEGLLPLVMAAAQTCAALPSDRVDLIDEDDAGCGFLRLLEEIADARGADADEHLDEVGTGDREERDPGFAGDRPRKERLPGPRRTQEEDAFGNTCAERLELLRVFEELDDFGQLLLRFVDPGDVVERHLGTIFGEQFRARAPERERLAPAALRLSEDEDQQERHQDEGDELNDHPQELRARLLLDGDLDVVRLTGDIVPRDRDLGDLVAVDFLIERAVADLRRTRLLDDQPIEDEDDEDKDCGDREDRLEVLTHCSGAPPQAARPPCRRREAPKRPGPSTSGARSWDSPRRPARGPLPGSPDSFYCDCPRNLRSTLIPQSGTYPLRSSRFLNRFFSENRFLRRGTPIRQRRSREASPNRGGCGTVLGSPNRTLR